MKADAALTHHDPLAGDVAAAVAVLCRVLMGGASWPAAKLVAAEGRLPETVAAITEGGLDLSQERAKLAAAQCERVELDVATRKGPLVETSEVKEE